ncbi:hypothetical protein F5B22DRAFT_650692 [Xylaria bambusicola]|uniref:uncharacterized protein n=1 Tax=Xylaria bambusicola TaxID=326684 RepID=UPI002007CD88|nr:uncharacterized protein F5B22DRAFT_650692 [Xylaria bambusicola]KAI0506441.1 hypothetical protein F5B22DRAFT_650692 [Xylaria bambusicola]
MASHWQNLINKRVALAKLCLATENFTTFHVLAAQQATAPSARDDLPADVVSTIDNLNIDTVDTGKKDYKDFSDDVETLKDQPPDEELWKAKINEGAEKAKERAVAAIEKGRVDAIAYIGELPEAVREPASNLWNEGLTTVMGFIENLYQGLKDIIQAIMDFLKGIWDKITTTWNTIKSAAQAAIDFIGGLFSLSAPSAKPTFLPASTSLSHVQRQIGSYLKQLSSSTDPVSSVTVNKQSRGWEITVL